MYKVGSIKANVNVGVYVGSLQVFLEMNVLLFSVTSADQTISHSYAKVGIHN